MKQRWIVSKNKVEINWTLNEKEFQILTQDIVF